MTIQELYIFACKNDLLDKDIYEVINKFKTSSEQNSNKCNNKPYNSFVNCREKDNIEWSYEDVLELFTV